MLVQDTQYFAVFRDLDCARYWRSLSGSATYLLNIAWSVLDAKFDYVSGRCAD